MARLFVGLSALQGDLSKYSRQFDMVEVHPIDTALPRIGTLRKWRKSAEPSFILSVVLPRAVGTLTLGPELDEALAATLEVATTLEARAMVLQTPADVRPTAANKKRLAEVFERIPRDGVLRCWEPSGIWEREEILATARTLGVYAVFDAAREALAPGSIAYTRLRALGKTTGLSSATVQRVADRIRKRREALVVVEAKDGAHRVKTALARELAKLPTLSSGFTVVRPTISTLVAEDEEQ
jgi:uncharacterized protein YecE (DUF72 family)